MAQTAPPPPADAPRPLPRRPPGGVPKAARPPRLVPLDGVWMAVLALASALVSAQALPLRAADRAGLTGAALAAVTAALLYLLGWRARDRAGGVAAGLLLATSLPFALHAAAAPRDALLALLSVASLVSFVAGSSLLALALTGLAAVARPDGLLLGAVLLGLALAQRRRRAALGAALFVVFAGLGWAALIGVGHQHFPAPHVGARGGLAAWAVAPGMAFVTWMLLPFCAELGEAPRRARWLVVALWTITYFAASCLVRVGDFEGTLFPLLPVWFALAGGGLSRLLPALVGEVPWPGARYLLATVAVLSLIAMRFTSERHLLVPAPTVVVRPAPVVPPPARPVPPAVVAAPVHPAAPPAPAHAATEPAPRPTPKPAPKATAKPAAPTVALYVRRDGHLVRRSLWAIAWDKAHPGAH